MPNSILAAGDWWRGRARHLQNCLAVSSNESSIWREWGAGPRAACCAIRTESDDGRQKIGPYSAEGIRDASERTKRALFERERRGRTAEKTEKGRWRGKRTEEREHGQEDKTAGHRSPPHPASDRGGRVLGRPTRRWSQLMVSKTNAGKRLRPRALTLSAATQSPLYLAPPSLPSTPTSPLPPRSSCP